jgi:hypothetical protein
LRALSACALLACLACAAKQAEPHPGMEMLWREFLAMPHERALAIAGDPARSRWVGAASGGHASASEAEEDALAECRRRRAVRRLQDACVVYARGDEIVWARW